VSTNTSAASQSSSAASAKETPCFCWFIASLLGSNSIRAIYCSYDKDERQAGEGVKTRRSDRKSNRSRSFGQAESCAFRWTRPVRSTATGCFRCSRGTSALPSTWALRQAATGSSRRNAHVRGSRTVPATARLPIAALPTPLQKPHSFGGTVDPKRKFVGVIIRCHKACTQDVAWFALSGV
jgi:hypothetical protein